MKFNNVLPLITASLLAINANGVAASEAGNLTIEMHGIHANQGQAIFILMDSASSHQGKSSIFTRKLIPVNQNSAKVTFSEVPSGEYSAVIYQDLNGNGKLDRYFFGMPREPYGFSNNARNPVGIPDFDESKFKLSSNPIVQKITVK